MPRAGDALLIVAFFFRLFSVLPFMHWAAVQEPCYTFAQARFRDVASYRGVGSFCDARCLRLAFGVA